MVRMKQKYYWTTALLKMHKDWRCLGADSNRTVLFVECIQLLTWVTLWSSSLFEKPRVVHLLKNIPTFRGTRKVSTMFNSLSVFPDINHIIPFHSTSLGSVSTISFHFGLILPSAFTPSDHSTDSLHAFLFSQCVLHFLPIYYIILYLSKTADYVAARYACSTFSAGAKYVASCSAANTVTIRTARCAFP
jgi:hypothetical protein